MASQTCIRNFLVNLPKVVTAERGNAWRSSLGKIGRRDYLDRYDVKLIRPNGSTIIVPATEPHQIFQSAVDLKQLSEDERRQRLAARKPKTKISKTEAIDDTFDESKYVKFWSTLSSKKI